MSLRSSNAHGAAPDAGVPQLLIVGASARAAAHSAARAGFVPSGIDLFADRDLAAVGRAARVEPDRWPDGLIDAAAMLPACPWVYTGALENRPDLVDRLAQSRPLWGNGGDVLRAVRDPIALAAALWRAGLPAPDARLDAGGLPGDGSWLIKPRASAGGRRIRPLTGEPPGEPDAVYYQERIAGVPCAAVFVAHPGARGAELVGLTRQWVGRPGAPFAYRGSLGPLPIGQRLARRLVELGRVLAGAFELVGLFGVDLIVRDGVPWPVEVNPRYTASVEVLELALGRALLADHRAACDPAWRSARQLRDPVVRGARFVGKAIVFAQCAGRVPRRCRVLARDLDPMRDPFGVPSYADLPRAGTRLRAGDPVLTLIEADPSLEDCQRRLRLRLRRWGARLAMIWVFRLFQVSTWAWLVFGLGLALALLVRRRFDAACERGARVAPARWLTGADAAAEILHLTEQEGVTVVAASGPLADYYDSERRVVRLSEAVHDGTSLASIGLAAHEVGHALQDVRRDAPMPLGVRDVLAFVARLGAPTALLLVLSGLIYDELTVLIELGLVVFTLSAAAPMLGLRLERDASRRGRRGLAMTGLIDSAQVAVVGDVLDAAAWADVDHALPRLRAPRWRRIRVEVRRPPTRAM